VILHHALAELLHLIVRRLLLGELAELDFGLRAFTGVLDEGGVARAGRGPSGKGLGRLRAPLAVRASRSGVSDSVERNAS
jgi:hypothetical protein